MTSVAIVEDDQRIHAFLDEHLALDGYDVVVADSKRIDVTIIDRNGSTASTLREMTGGGQHAHGSFVIALTDQADPLHRERLLRAGADDVMAKPFAYAELRARIDAVIRRRRGSGRIIRFGDLTLDPFARMASVNDQQLDLSKKEFALLQMLAGDPTRVFAKEELLRDVWGHQVFVGGTRTLDSHACRVRRKLNAVGGSWIVNVWGVGYRLCNPSTVNGDWS